ncbi:helix-turn-helix domain-containing protein [Microvirga sp. VF16]|uniref:helix-turn-helix domain-containing protein n=1 Tax=Microvirga sp. VF16 TaxID=2807101 RepID=UPI0035302263
MRGLAHATGIAASTISRIESGKLSPTLDNVLKIAAVLQLEPHLADNNQSEASTEAKVAEDHPTRMNHELITYRRIATTVLKPGTRRDVSNLAARNGYTTAVLLRGIIELRSSTGIRERLTRGATINCRLITRHEFYLIAIQEAELIWIV